MTARELLDYSLKAIGLRAMSNRATVTDAVWLRMVRGQKPDGSRGVPPIDNWRRGVRYEFQPHQNKRERRRRMMQAYRGVLTPEQFYNRDEWREAGEMHLVVVAAEAKGLAA